MKSRNLFLSIGPYGVIDFFFALSRESISSLLVIFLVQKIKLSDLHAVQFLSTKEALLYLMPFISSVFFLNQIKNVTRIKIGLIGMASGQALLILDHPSALYLGIILYAFSYAIGRPMIPLMVADKFKGNSYDALKELYVFAAIASFLGPLIYGIFMQMGSWHVIFASLSIINGMGFIWACFISKIFKGYGTERFVLSNDLLKTIGAILLLGSISYISLSNRNVYYMVTSCALSLLYLFKLEQKQLSLEKKNLKGLFAIFIAMIIYFSLQTPQYAVFPIFLQRDVNRIILDTEIPVSWFFASMSVFLLICSFVMNKSSFLKDFCKKNSTSVSLISVILTAFLALISTYCTTIAIYIMMLTYGLMCLGGLLLVPAAQNLIGNIKGARLQRSFMGILYLTMAIARLAGAAIISWSLQGDSQNITDFSLNFTMLTSLSSLIVFIYYIIAKLLSLWAKKN
jgi:dipeptide/tripeptide permease